MRERVEFHPLAVRVVTWLLALLNPRVRSEDGAQAGGVLEQRITLTARQCGSRIAIDCTQSLVNRSGATLCLDWSVPQSSSTLGARLLPEQSIESVTQHAYALAHPAARSESMLRVQLDAVLPLGGSGVRRQRGAACLTVGSPDQSPPPILGVLARLTRAATAGLVCHSAAGDRAVFRGTLAGRAVRLRLALG